MLTYELKKMPGVPLYEALYRCIRGDILSGNLKPGEKLPSKRALAAHLELGKTTVEAAYAQLLSEGYIRSTEKVGFFVEAVDHAAASAPIPISNVSAKPSMPVLLDLTANGTDQFPFTVWSRLQREVILDYDRALLKPMPIQGIPELRLAIAQHLAAFRGMSVDPETIIIGAGTDFLYNLLIQLLGRDKIYAVEDPGYQKISRLYTAAGAKPLPVPMDSFGVIPGELRNADVLHISPSHHFPTGLITPLKRRQELLAWASGADKWIIEDDYDSEFRFTAHPLPAMQSLNPQRVIYMNTFSKSLAPSIRISFMVLPRALMDTFCRELNFYSCTVPSFEQYTLSRFLSRGYFEKHINRMRKFYHSRRNRLVAALEGCRAADKLTILEQNAGLHFLLQVDTDLPDNALVEALAGQGIRVQALSSFFHAPQKNLHTLVINYSGIHEENLPEAVRRIEEILT